MVAWSVLHRATLLCLVVGLAFSLYATAESVDKALQSSCNVNSYVQCGKVDSSSYSHIGPIPDYSLGIGGFLLMLVFEGLLIQRFEPIRLHILLILTIAGVGVSIALGSIEVFVISAFCPVCLGAYLSNVGVLACVVTMERKRPPKSYRLRMERKETAAGVVASSTATGDDEEPGEEADDAGSDDDAPEGTDVGEDEEDPSSPSDAEDTA